MLQRRGSSGNFLDNPEKAREAGRKGGQISNGNVINNRERIIAVGRTGGKVIRRPASEKAAQ
ncbi:general stress protein [Pantoea sp. KPR_PJ]|uniref:general stress protein n=1 Tax=Pantoea sp. KPR_PJ TaxID=2738375 RepID=UPI00352849A8